MITENSRGNVNIFELSDSEKKIEVKINPGKEDVAFVISQDFNFLEKVGEATKKEAQKILGEELNLRISGETQVAGVFQDEFSIVLLEDAELFAGKRWAEEEKKLYP